MEGNVIEESSDTETTPPNNFLTIVNNHTEKDNKYFVCNICTFTTRWASHFKVHSRTHSGEKPFRCAQCPYTSARYTDLKRHETVHSDVKRFLCEYCSYRGRRKSDLVRHQKLHLDDKPFRCLRCDYSTTRKEVLKAHEVIHFKEVVPADSEPCEWEISSDLIMLEPTLPRLGLWYVRPSPARYKKKSGNMVRLKCEQCGFFTQCRNDFVRHLKIHDVTYKCPHCNYNTDRPVQFQVHLRIHKGLKHYQCDVCSYVSVHKSEMVRHTNTHPLTDKTIQEYNNVFRKYGKVIRPCYVNMERLPMPAIDDEVRIQIANVDQLPSYVFQNRDDEKYSTCCIIIRRNDESNSSLCS